MNGSKTLRQWAGLPATQNLVAAKTALLLIDFQMEYYSGNLPIPEGEAAVAQAARLIDWADAAGMRVVHVAHEAKSAASPLFAPGAEGSRFHPAVQPKPAHKVVKKAQVSAFAGTDLDAWLKAAGVDTLVICGLASHMCVSTAARDASPLGYKVIVAGDATGSRDLPAWDGSGVVPWRELHRAALTELADRFAEVLKTDAILALPAA